MTYAHIYQQRKCRVCDKNDFVEDDRTGDLICTNDGVVALSRRMCDTMPEYRVFQDDPASRMRVRVGPMTHMSQVHVLRTTSTKRLRAMRREDDAMMFLDEATRDINEIFTKLYRGGSNNGAARNRAHHLFQLVYKHQLKEKEANKRHKFSRRKQFVITSVYYALWKQHEEETEHEKPPPSLPWTTKQLSDLVQGIDVSYDSVKRCLNELNGYMREETTSLSK